MISKFFIERPVFSAVMSIIIVIAGLLSMRVLPVEEYPQVTPPQVVVQTVYPGADAEVIANSVATILENAINGVEGMIYMQSSSSASGSITISVFFTNETDPDDARVDINNRVQSVMSVLPQEVQRMGVNVYKRTSTILGVYTLFTENPNMSRDDVANYLLINILDEIKRVPGVGQAIMFSEGQYAMRIWLDPAKLAQYNLTSAEILALVQEQNAQFAVGQFGADPSPKKLDFTYTVTTQGRLKTPEEFGNILIRVNEDGSSLRLKDLARLELGAQSYSVNGYFEGKVAVPFGVFLQSGANALAVSDGVHKRLEELKANFPEGMEYRVPYDTAEFVRESVSEVYKTFIEAIILVVLVVYLFLQNFRATIIPVIAIPVSIIGTFAGMYLSGYSVNLLTLFGLILAIGIVVDDAIIVIENVERIIHTEKIGVKAATIKAMEEISGPVVAIVLVLCAVFVPVAFVGGFAGEIYKQFAITIVISVIISGFVALTLTPALCATFLKEKEPKPFYLVKKFNDAFDWLTHKFTASVARTIRKGTIYMFIFAAIIAIAVSMWGRLSTSLVPSEDKGMLITGVQAPLATALHKTTDIVQSHLKTFLEHPDIETGMGMAGYDMLAGAQRTNGAIIFVKLKNWKERKRKDQSSFVLAPQFMGKLMQNPGALTFVFNPPPIMGLSLTDGFEMYVQDRTGGSFGELENIAKQVVAEASKREELTNLRTTISSNVPQYRVILDRDKAKAMGISIASVFTTLSSTFGAYYVNDFNIYGRSFRVYAQSEAEYRESPDDLNKVFVRSGNGELVPISTLVSVERIVGPDIIERFNLFPAAKITGDAKFGYSSGDALKAIEEVAAQVLPSGYTTAFSGTSYQQKASASTGTIAFALGIVFAFLIL